VIAVKTLRKLLISLSFLSLTGCVSVDTFTKFIPSFWDDNQSAAITNVRTDIAYIDCNKPQLIQAQNIERDASWFILYSESKGITQGDVIAVVKPIRDTAVEWVERAKTKEPSVAYCKIKKDILDSQAEAAAKAVLGRY